MHRSACGLFPCFGVRKTLPVPRRFPFCLGSPDGCLEILYQMKTCLFVRSPRAKEQDYDGSHRFLELSGDLHVMNTPQTEAARDFLSRL